MTIDACILSGNSANGWEGGGGGIENYSTAMIHASTLSGNSANLAGRGGGMKTMARWRLTPPPSAATRPTPTTKAFLLTRWYPGYGGGIYNGFGGTMTVDDSTISGNVAGTYFDSLFGGVGGGVFNVGW